MRISHLNKSQTAFYLAVTVPTQGIMNRGTSGQRSKLFLASKAGLDAMDSMGEMDSCTRGLDLYREAFCVSLWDETPR